MKDLKDKISESYDDYLANQAEYHVAWLDCKDEEDLPISSTILVDKQYIKTFEKFLNDQEGNLFAHADGGNVEY